MREVILRVPRAAVEDVLDRLLPIVPAGVREIPAGRHVELKVRGDDLPPLEELRRAVGRWPHRVSKGEVSDDWRERRAADYGPDLIGGRLVVRPEWAPASGAEIEIALGESSAFGGGSHPTTRKCLELLLELPAAGAFADLGCGSGVLAILAAKLGWEPVIAIDNQPASVETARENAARNHVEIDARIGDLAAESAPTMHGFAANVPGNVHSALTLGWRDVRPQLGLVSGFATGDAVEVADAYAGCGLREQRRIEVHGWAVLVVSS